MKKLSGILLIILAAAAIVSAAISYRAWNEHGETKAAFDEQKALAMDVRQRIGDVNLRYRGLMEGMKAVPDSLKTQMVGEYQRSAEGYRKQLYRLEAESRETERLFGKRKRAESAARENLHRKLMVLGGATILLLSSFIWWARAIRS